jgi:hypothetical protein
MKVPASLPFHGMMTPISVATTWYQVRPSALMMPSVIGFTAPPDVLAIVSARWGGARESIVAPACCSRACSAISCA